MSEEEEAVAAALRGLDREELSAFVADLWAARGWDVERDGDVIRVRNGDEERALAPIPATRLGARSVPEAADTTVTPDPGTVGESGTRIVDAERLVEMLRYGVPPEATERLATEHLGAPVADLDLPAAVRGRRALGTLPLRRLGVSVALLAVAATLALTLPLNSLLAAGTAPADSNDTGNAAAPASVVSSNAEPATTVPRTEIDLPGLNESAITAASVVSAHRATLYRLPYEMGMTQTVTVPDGETRIRTRTVAQVGERYTLEERGDGIENRELYDNGTATFVATFENDSRVYRRVAEELPDPRNESVQHVSSYLATEEPIKVRGQVSVNGVRTVLVVGEGSPGQLNATNYSVEALFDRNGLIRRMTATYDRPDGSDVRVTWRYRQLGLGEFEAPTWYEQEFAG